MLAHSLPSEIHRVPFNFIGAMSTVIDDLGGDGLDFDGEHSANEYVPSPEELQSVENIDWEDLSKDYNHLYIGDFGNNLGNRVDLNIIKINITDFISSNNFEIENISFSYSDQTNFNNSIYNHNYDAEAIIATEYHLYIFTKNSTEPFRSGVIIIS